MGTMINRRRVCGGKIDPYAQYAVDLGLPSGLLWMDRNIGANTETDYGLYFAWGETTGYVNAAARNAALGLTGGFDQASYEATGASQISADLTLQQDAAHAYLGGDWRMPSSTEFKELCDNCTSLWTTENGVNGRRFTSNINGNSIFIPATGSYVTNSLNGRDSTGLYWSTYSSGSMIAKSLYFTSSHLFPQDNNNRRYGFTVRSVKSPR